MQLLVFLFVAAVVPVRDFIRLEATPPHLPSPTPSPYVTHDNGRPTDPRKISQWISSFTETVLGWRLLPSQWRQLIVFLHRGAVYDPDPEEDPDIPEIAYAGLMGHTTETHKLQYGNAKSDTISRLLNQFSALGTDKIILYYDACTRHWLVMGVDQVSLSSTRLPQQNSLKRAVHPTDSPSRPSKGSPSPLMTTRAPPPTQPIFRTSLLAPTTLPADHTDIHLAPVHPSADITRDLLQFFPTPYRHPYFASLVPYSLASFETLHSAPLLLVAPPGCGKTTLFWVAAFRAKRHEPHRQFVVVVLPTKALKQDQQQRAAYYRRWFQSHAWSTGNDHHCNPSPGSSPLHDLILVSAEDACTPSFRLFLTAAVTNQTIDRVFVDEAHLLYIDSAWRRTLLDLSWLSTLPNIPIIFLSGTFPPSIVPLFKSHLSIPRLAIFRVSPTITPSTPLSFQFVKGSPKNRIALLTESVRHELGDYLEYDAGDHDDESTDDYSPWDHRCNSDLGHDHRAGAVIVFVGSKIDSFNIEAHFAAEGISSVVSPAWLTTTHPNANPNPSTLALPTQRYQAAFHEADGASLPAQPLSDLKPSN